MVSDKVNVQTKSWKEGSATLSWVSDGKTGYEIDESEDQKRGTSITIALRDEHEEFSKDERVKEVLQSYSALSPFPIILNGERVNNIEALWMKSNLISLRKITLHFISSRQRLLMNLDTDYISMLMPL